MIAKMTLALNNNREKAEANGGEKKWWFQLIGNKTNKVVWKFKLLFSFSYKFKYEFDQLFIYVSWLPYEPLTVNTGYINKITFTYCNALQLLIRIHWLHSFILSCIGLKICLQVIPCLTQSGNLGIQYSLIAT